MDSSFASVEWLSQSSSKNNTEETTLANNEQTSMYFPWTPGMLSASNIGYMAPNPETQGPIYPGYNNLSSYVWDNEKPTYCEVTPYTADNQNLYSSKELYQMDMNISSNSTYNGQYNALENLNGTNGDSSISQETISSIQESSMSQGEQTKVKEDSANSGCTTSTTTTTNDSGYESEISRSTTNSPEVNRSELPSETHDEQSRRMRTAFTSEQLTTLEDTFQKYRYLGASERRKLAEKLNLSEVQIKTWFQNRRMKYKRELQEGRQLQFSPAHIYRMYGTPTISPYPYTHPPMPLHFLGSMPYSYSTPSVAFDSFIPYKPKRYFPTQLYFPPDYNQEEHSVLRF